MHGRICIVDDNIDITISFKSGLETYGYKVQTYNDPVLALSNFSSESYELLLIDIRMPIMNGFELYEKIREKDAAVRICFITAFIAYYYAILEEYPNIDCKCFIEKPIEISRLAKIIEKELNIYHGW